MIGIRRADGVPGRTGRGRGADERLQGVADNVAHDAATVDSGERRRRGVHREPEDDLRPRKAADVDARQLRIYIVAPLAESSLVAGRRGPLYDRSSLKREREREHFAFDRNIIN